MSIGSELLDPDHLAEDVATDDSLPLRELLRLAGGCCTDCARPYSARDAVGSIALGFKNAPRCLTCVSTRLRRPEADLRSQIRGYCQRRECYLKAWREAERLDGVMPDQESVDAPHPVELPASTAATEAWDAGDMGCGELVMALRLKMKSLPAGAVLRLTATDPAAPEDLPAWCRMTGHQLAAMEHPNYFIRRRGD